MSPEQVRAENVDHRSDIFSFGAVLHEMLTGKRAFQKASGAETMNAILKEDPPEIEDPSLRHLVRHCLEMSRWALLRWVVWLTAALLVAAAFLIGRRTASATAPEFHQLTFRQGNVFSARFASDGNTIVSVLG